MSSNKKKKGHVDITAKAAMEGLTAKRFAGKPLKQPHYSFRDVPRCPKDLRGSVLQEVTSRDYFNDCMAEMVLLCKEVMRRQAESLKKGKRNNKNPVKRTSKPLSLEYIADRIDVDDPIFGFFVRTAITSADGKPADEKPPASAAALSGRNGIIPSQQLVEGMLQGFITVTTFTNWQNTFRFDSMHDSAFSYDDADLAEDMMNGKRKYDRNGELAEELEATVRCGDPWNEGIVWPRIAEVSLLGALGCGKALLELVIERLECMSPNKTQNYDYVVLQATDNSVPFYESMGFVRVGCITEDEQFEKKQKHRTNSDDEKDADATPELAIDTEIAGDDCRSALLQHGFGSVPRTEDATKTEQAKPNEISSSPVVVYKTKKPYEKLSEIARRFNVNVWDIIFLNKDVYSDILPASCLMKDTELFIPDEKARYDATSNALRNDREFQGKSTAVQWYLSEDDETPKEIANRFKVNCRDLVNANRDRIPDLQPSSRLIMGTRIRVSHFHIHDDKHVPYCHWTFPDDTLETSEPSYMMAKKLNRKTRTEAKLRPVERSFAVPVTKYELQKPSTTLGSKRNQDVTPGSAKKQKGRKKRERHPDEPVPPKKPANAFMLYCSEVRRVMSGKPASEITKLASAQWKDLPEIDRSKYKDMSQQARAEYNEASKKHQLAMDAFRKANPEWVAEQEKISASKKAKTTLNLFSKVVKLTSDGVRQAGDEFKYYFVLTYLPDLQWCHLAPMRKAGVYGKEKPKAEGRPIWMLVDENEGKEVDISAGCCEIVKARATKNTEDADKEQWDIPESGPATISSSGVTCIQSVLPLAAPFTNRANDGAKQETTRESLRPVTFSSQRGLWI